MFVNADDNEDRKAMTFQQHITAYRSLQSQGYSRAKARETMRNVIRRARYKMAKEAAA